jgi:hypothetical protein
MRASRTAGYHTGVMRGVGITSEKPKKRRKYDVRDSYITVSPRNLVDVCLNCTKPASKCKGDCAETKQADKRHRRGKCQSE